MAYFQDNLGKLAPER